MCAGSRVYELMSPMRMVSAAAVADPSTTPAAITAATPAVVENALKDFIFFSR